MLKNVTEPEAVKMTAAIDQKRNALYELILGRKFDPDLFDLVFNCSTFSKQQIVHTIISLMESREMI
jgi:hypothetical protein